MALKQLMKGSELIISNKGELYHISLARKHGFPPRFLMVGDPGRVKQVAKHFDGGEIKGKQENREYVSVSTVVYYSLFSLFSLHLENN